MHCVITTSDGDNKLILLLVPISSIGLFYRVAQLKWYQLTFLLVTFEHLNDFWHM